MSDEAHYVGTLTAVRRFLGRTGWERIKLPERNLELFSLPGDNPLEIVLPVEPGSDYRKRIDIALRTLGAYSDLPRHEVLDTIRFAFSDLLKATVPDTAV